MLQKHKNDKANRIPICVDLPLFKASKSQGSTGLGLVYCLENSCCIVGKSYVDDSKDVCQVILGTNFDSFGVSAHKDENVYVVATGFIKVKNFTTVDSFKTPTTFSLPSIKNPNYVFDIATYHFDRNTTPTPGLVYDVYKDSTCSQKGWDVNSDFFKFLYDTDEKIADDLDNIGLLPLLKKDDLTTSQQKNFPSMNDTKKYYESYVRPIIEYMKDKKIGIETKPITDAHNIILSGPPGVGKSHIVANNIIPKLIPNSAEQITNIERITITPSTTFEDFFGCYKPQMSEHKDPTTGERKIVYDFAEGVFCRLLKKALNGLKEDKKFVLVVEELNRADVYDVFGQVFQLLDRDKNVPISTPKDALEYFNNRHQLYIPDNMYIICTMNSADQGVHMLDTAFKRRFEMVYVNIEGAVYAPKNIPLTNIEPATISLPDLSCKQYHDVRKAINEALKHDDITEDKLIAEYFLKTDHKPGDLASGRDVSSIEFIVKVLGYLLQNVYKTKPICDKIFNTELKNQGNKNSSITLWQLLEQDSWEKILNADIAKIITNKKV